MRYFLIAILLLVGSSAFSQGIWRPSGFEIPYAAEGETKLGSINVPSVIADTFYSNPITGGTLFHGQNIEVRGHSGTGGIVVNNGAYRSGTGFVSIIAQSLTSSFTFAATQNLTFATQTYSYGGGYTALGTMYPWGSLSMTASVKADTLIAPLKVVDTTNYVASDTLNYWITEVSHPVSYGFGGGLVVKEGYVRFTVPVNTGLGAVTGKFVSDSANGVYFKYIHQIGRGGRVGLGTTQYIAVVDEWIAIENATTAINWGSLTNSKVSRLRGWAENPGTFIRGFSCMGVSGVASDSYGLVDVYVYFVMDADNTSDWYVKIEEL